MQPADIARLVSPGDPRVSPDGGRIAVVVTRVDLEADRYRSTIWLAPADGPPRQLTSGDADTCPRWSPDGTRLAFTRSVSGHHQLVVLPVDGPGEPVTLVDRESPIGELAWSPDGSAIAFTSREARPDAPPFTVVGTPDRATLPRRVDRLFPKLDGEGWTVDRPRAVFVVAADVPGDSRLLAHHRYDIAGPAWSPDGRSLAVTTVRDEPDADLTMVEALHLLDVASGELRPLTTSPSISVTRPSWSPDGTSVAVLAEDVTLIPSFGRIAVVPAEGGDPRVLTAGLDRQAAPFVGGRAPLWRGTDLLFTVEDHGTQPLHAVPADGSAEPVEVVGGTRAIVGYDEAAGTLAILTTGPTTRPELAVVRDGRETTLSSFSAAFHRDLPVGEPEHLRVPSSGGGEIDAWLLRPRSPALADTDGRLALLLSVHGGPMTQYPTAWFDEFALWSGAGYAVLWCNPHGSTGDTEAALRSIRTPEAAEVPGTGWGGVDADDVLAALDAALAHDPTLDPARVGVLGGSYGGFMTTWLVGHTDRFAAACSERAANNLLSLEWGGSDLAGFFRFELGVDHLARPDVYRRVSPTSYVEHIHTPLLILHADEDLRCPPEQADQLYVALRLLGREVEYWRFPGEGHELSRSGSPRRRVQRAEIILDFFARHLAPGAP
ncbi:S9 family peptidase [Actinomycetospora corticicola]|uniref:Dipeptidyl aminopeptidase/acylaminoacyl peptidase n=1 Tax=Actinomycetospora corticicola TaxID=663602 RepID=A0A7Y9E1N9_9PSEU|nr:S9 family peptidase [Actinomycetospora corticicola]NYD39598.1 dipeptidyl aminopeptidase/acylaminoacyl peptidase [Actinomycetospora corticicola]